MSLDLAIDSLGGKSGQPDRLRPVRIWLYVIAFMVLIMVAVGGLTRLTDSGLSITEWKPISGTIPPLSQADWQAEFEAYQQIPEYQLQNHWMSLDEFKFIFWWEWGHRFLGRVIGLAFAVPLVVFLIQRRIPQRLTLPLVGLFILGGLQGALGWWMVSSGLTERVDVSQYRLAAHLAAASLLFFALIYVARRIRPQHMDVSATIKNPQTGLVTLGILVFIQIVMGAFVAGLDAGFGYNTWPLMDGAWIPAGLWVLDPWWLNLFETHLTVQFIHRMLAYLIIVLALFFLARAWMRNASPNQRSWLTLITLIILGQAVLGIATLLLVIPLPLALGHQSLAFMLFGAIAAALSDRHRVIA